MTRGILYMVWGGYSGSLMRSISSVKHWHPELEYHVAEMPSDSTVLCKSHMHDLSPFDETLFLDADTTVLGRLDYGFIKARQFGFALTHSANPWNRRYHKLVQHEDEAEYSSGVVFFVKRREMQRLFDDWLYLSTNTDSTTLYDSDEGVKEQKYNDQALLTLAIHLTGLNPFVLPQNWNLVPKYQRQFFGPVKIWHGAEDIPQSLLKWNEEQSRPGAILKCAALA
jgi:alpha-N-acetylglucosamine transferase